MRERLPASHWALTNAGVAQRLVHQFAILGMWFRLPSSALSTYKTLNPRMIGYYKAVGVKE